MTECMMELFAYEKAAEAGFAHAMNFLAEMYLSGVGVTAKGADVKEAVMRPAN
jgi:TPR repeat protein